MALNRIGVYTTESTLRAAAPTPPTNSDTLAAFFGEASRGPVSPSLVTSWPDYQNQFGSLSSTSDLGYALYHYFTNGGRVAYVARVVGDAAEAADGQVEYHGAAVGGSTVGDYTAFTVTAKNPGTWGNAIEVVVSAGTVTSTNTRLPSFRIAVLLNGTEVETWSDLSLNPDDGRYVESILNNFSSYLTVSDVVTPEPDEDLYIPAETYTLSGGVDESATDSDYVAALGLLSDVEGSLLINVVGKSGATVVNAALGVAAGRGNSFVIIDPDPEAVVDKSVDATDVLEYADEYSSDNPGYGALYYPMLKMVDPIRRGPAAVRDTYPGGAVAGAYIRTDAERGVGKTPAGYGTEVRGALNLAARVSDVNAAILYDAGVNLFKAVPGAGVVILGGRTLERARPDKFISIRRSLNFVKQGINDIARSALFEPNDANLWTDLTARIDQFLTTFWGRGGLKGNTAADAFYVVCNSTNNTAVDQEDGVVNVEVGVALQYPAEFIVVNVSQWTGGSNTSETIPTL